MDNDELTSRFAYLLKPIRDLSQNWEIDIAGLLTEYLHELENTNITIEGYEDEAISVNFTQAAFIVQNSSNVYSKKVEYLIQLVHKVYESIKNRKNKAKKNAEEEKDGNKEDEETPNTEDDCMLYEICKEKNTDFVHDKSLLFHTNSIDATSESISLDPVPFFLNMATTAEKYGEKLYSSNGKLLGLQSDFNMFTSVYHQTNGCQILKGCSGDLIESDESREIVSEANPMMSNGGDGVEGHGGGDEGCEEDVFMPEINDCDVEHAADETRINHDDNDDNVDNELPEDIDMDISLNIVSLRNRKTTITDEVKDPYELLCDNGLIEIDKNPIGTDIFYILPKENAPTLKRKKKRKSFDEEQEILKENIINFIDKNFYQRHDCMALSTYVEYKDIYLEGQKKYLSRKNRKKKALRRNLFQENNSGTDKICNDNDNDDLGVDYDDFGGGDSNRDSNRFSNDYGDNNLDNMMENREYEITYEQKLYSQNDAYFNVQSNRKETHLVQMVSAWFNEIVPQLKEEEKRNNFDIYEYGTAILKTLKKLKNKQWVPFKYIIQERIAFEIPRILLSTLLLANMGNIEIKSLHSDVDNSLNIVNEFEIKLLSMQRHRDLMEENLQKE